jgi:hypothetical protein
MSHTWTGYSFCQRQHSWLLELLVEEPFVLSAGPRAVALLETEHLSDISGADRDESDQFIHGLCALWRA